MVPIATLQKLLLPRWKESNDFQESKIVDSKNLSERKCPLSFTCVGCVEVTFCGPQFPLNKGSFLFFVESFTSSTKFNQLILYALSYKLIITKILCLIGRLVHCILAPAVACVECPAVVRYGTLSKCFVLISNCILGLCVLCLLLGFHTSSQRHV